MMRSSARQLLASLLLGTALAACSDDPSGIDNPAPRNVAVTAPAPTRVVLTFDPVKRATGYVVQRAMGSGAYVVRDTVEANSFEDPGLVPGNTYRYQVASIVGGAQGAFSTEVSVTTTNAFRTTIDADIRSNRTLTADTIYTLKGFIKVRDGATLTILPGTRIEGDFNTVGSSLFILRDSKIGARGTAENPIVFTSSRPSNVAEPGDWGGVIIVGRGRINRASPVLLEGTENFPASERVDYSGGDNNADNSGELRYVRIEFAGYATAPNAELNSLTLAAVGSGTKMEYVQVTNGLDDGFEWFGGAVDGKYLVSYEAGDDHFDASEGFIGRNQFLIALQTKKPTTRPAAGAASGDPTGIENDGCGGAGCTNGQLSQPYTIPVFANFTVVGSGLSETTQGELGMVLRRGVGGFYVNGIIARNSRAAISLRDAATQERMNAGQLVVRNLLLAQNGVALETGSGRLTMDLAANAIQTAAGTAAAQFVKLGAATSAADLDWSLSATSEARSGGTGAFNGALATAAGTAVTGTTYRGAADPAAAKGWWEGWTRYYPAK